MQNQQKQVKDLWESMRLVAIGISLLAVIFIVPDVGATEHKSIFAVAMQSHWGQHLDWESAWCSVKIILLGLAALAFVKAVLGLLLDRDFKGFDMAVFISAILPLLVGFLGVYGLIKAIL